MILRLTCLAYAFQDAGLPVWKKNLTPMWLRSVNLSSGIRENIALVLLTNVYNSSGLIKFKERNLVYNIN